MTSDGPGPPEPDDILEDDGPADVPAATPTDAVVEEPPVPAALKRRVDLTEGHLLHKIVLLAWPIVTASFLQWIEGVVDIKMVGQLGPEAIAAVGQSRSAIFTFMTVIFAVATGTQVLAARYMGERNHEGASEVARQAIILSVLFGAAIIPLGYVFSPTVLTMMGTEGVVHQAATDYMRVYFLGAIALMMNFMVISALRGAGDTLTPLWVLLIINSGNILFDWLLIFGVGPFPELGVKGAAWAVVMSRTIGAIIQLWIVSSGRFAIQMPLIARWRADLALWGKMFYIGVPSSIEGFTRNLAFLVVFWILNQTDAGRLAVAGYTVSMQMRMFGVMFGLALMSAAMTAVSQNMGADDPKRAERSGWAVTWISVAATGLMALVFISLSPWLIRFFTDDPEAVKWGIIALVTLSVALPFTGASMGFAGALRGAGDTLSPLYVSLIFVSIVGPGLAYILTVVLGFGPIGAWVGLSTAWIMQALTVGTIFRRGKWKQIEL
ncbi:MAG: MATE family efflux transporter [Armatimonadota bacterium]